MYRIMSGKAAGAPRTAPTSARSGGPTRRLQLLSPILHRSRSIGSETTQNKILCCNILRHLICPSATRIRCGAEPVRRIRASAPVFSRRHPVLGHNVIRNIFMVNTICYSEFCLIEMKEAKKPSKPGAPPGGRRGQWQRRQSTPSQSMDNHRSGLLQARQFWPIQENCPKCRLNSICRFCRRRCCAHRIASCTIAQSHAHGSAQQPAGAVLLGQESIPTAEMRPLQNGSDAGVDQCTPGA
jgi:hypothetical protein